MINHPAATLGAYGLPVFHEHCPACGMPNPGGLDPACGSSRFDTYTYTYEAPKYEPLKLDLPKYEPIKFDPPKYEYEPVKFDPPRYEYEPVKLDLPKYEPITFDSPKYEPIRFDPPDLYGSTIRTCIHGNTGYCILCH
jgi:hypothetical protein